MPSDRYLLTGLLVMLAVTLALRAAPFLLLGRLRDSPFLTYLSTAMPAGVMVILAVYTLHGTTTATALPAAAGLTTTVGLQLWRRSALLSVLAGTAVYMTALQLG
ncbi:branched-chain amino acid transporter permease [Kitasatospora sp. NPDC051853]|uniref:branched-chain amino acid transporter permease n=1 Tax=Kitasatospora sp. NPDC051853 TaxID=3364058 RepID=UPI00378C5D74